VKSTNCLYDYTDGTHFRNHAFFRNHPTAMRLHFYVDDFEVCDPLGSARTKHKITGIYFFLGNVEKRYTSSLRSIHVALLVRSNLVKKYSLDVIFERLVNDLQVLEISGITIQVNEVQTTIYGSLASLSADNLACHEVGGFRKTFSSGRICRNCLCFENRNDFFSEND